jgi:carbon storage regulator
VGHTPGSGVGELYRFRPAGCIHPGRTTRPTLKEEAPVLVLTRKTGQEIILDGNIRITVASCGDGRVKLGIEAPRDVRVDRAEVAERVAKEEAESVVELACR